MGSKIQNRKARMYVNATAAQHGKVALRSLHFRSQTALHTQFGIILWLARVTSDYKETAPYKEQLVRVALSWKGLTRLRRDKPQRFPKGIAGI